MMVWTPPPWATPPPVVLPPITPHVNPDWEQALWRKRTGKWRAASPTIAATGTSSQSGTPTSHTMAMPTGISAGDLLIAFFAFDNNPGLSGWPSDWVSFPQVRGGSFNTNASAWAYKFADGSESNFTLTTSSGVSSISRCWRISGDAGRTRPPLARCTPKTSGNGQTAEVKASEWYQPQDILSILACGWENQTPGTPTGYTNVENPGAGGAHARIDTKAISGFTGSENPPDYASGSGDRAEWTILVASDASDPDTTFPIIRQWYSSQGSTSNATSIPVALSPQREEGDWLVVMVSLVTNRTISGWPSGWSVTQSLVGGGSGGEKFEVGVKLCDGTETDFNLTASSTGSAYTTANLCVFNLDSGATPQSAGAVAGGSGTSPNPPNLSANSDIWIAMWEAEGSVATAYPANYTYKQERILTGSDRGNGGCATAYCARQLSATSEDPGTGTTNSGSFWAAVTLGLGKANPRFFDAEWS